MRRGKNDFDDLSGLLDAKTSPGLVNVSYSMIDQVPADRHFDHHEIFVAVMGHIDCRAIDVMGAGREQDMRRG